MEVIEDELHKEVTGDIETGLHRDREATGEGIDPKLHGDRVARAELHRDREAEEGA